MVPALPLTDGVVVVRDFEPEDADVIIAGRDEQFHRFMGEGSPSPRPSACVCVADAVIGWIDADGERDWLADDEVNVGYALSPDHRGRGHGTRALVLFSDALAGLTPPIRATLLIDPANRASADLANRAGFRLVGEVDGQQLFKR